MISVGDDVDRILTHEYDLFYCELQESVGAQVKDEVRRRLSEQIWTQIWRQIFEAIQGD